MGRFTWFAYSFELVITDCLELSLGDQTQPLDFQDGCPVGLGLVIRLHCLNRVKIEQMIWEKASRLKFY